MFSVSRCDPRLALRGPWARALASVHSTPVAVGHSGVLARCALPRFCLASLARPMGPEPRTAACFNELFAIN